MGEQGAKAVLFEQFARVGKALASGKRLELLDILAQGERTVESLARAAQLGMTTASAHLQTLKRANLVVTRGEGTKVHYRLAGSDVAALYALVRAVADAHLPDVEAARADYFGAGDGAEHVSREELLRRVELGDVVVLDVRPREEYQAGHIPGAVSVPLDELAGKLGEISADQEVVAYCRGSYCVLAHDAVRLLTAHGRPARRLAEGMLEWRLAELPVETT
ncbi:ArsR family transcriptional regulator [Saccharopolyspora erythraea NRRL 2338]|uniref:Possible transcriptional regulatory protein (Possibly ArsR-family) n=2 Tax=Saccharopolyspora erythraea TaxID=1836 RepID=A4FI03_SACEN|nr:metalloregulator ArsR/SmtB family transcription factor [Saccharopolyspora erythraea]EQD85056.1 ArsR family transcriptional regulator [Saccharopolyspora erythraea D]PFG97361.1 ArsR family transcriptional regulator [Saccharopolyspora erythraea NRRL 2338]QRK87546.1 metalloregulator ArsR/SmtB family transcription factor [Saccharopolyspora erythraea]CAM03678.1 possible transcriptional regulatory protein (possibly ArsR-family) [Saccharopolyspora erythraea NRRL 2338]